MAWKIEPQTPLAKRHRIVGSDEIVLYLDTDDAPPDVYERMAAAVRLLNAMYDPGEGDGVPCPDPRCSDGFIPDQDDDLWRGVCRVCGRVLTDAERADYWQAIAKASIQLTDDERDMIAFALRFVNLDHDDDDAPYSEEDEGRFDALRERLEL